MRRLPREAPGLAGRLLTALLVSILLVGVEARLGDGDVLRGLELQTLDWRFRLRGPIAPSDSITLVLVDDATVAGVGAWPLPREVVADAVGRLAAAGADVIVVNLLLAEAQASLSPTTRSLLVDALGSLPPDAAPLRERIEASLDAG
jgi:adenylate cyclase